MQVPAQMRGMILRSIRCKTSYKRSVHTQEGIVVSARRLVQISCRPTSCLNIYHQHYIETLKIHPIRLQLYLVLKSFKALNGLLCADVPIVSLRNYTRSLTCSEESIYSPPFNLYFCKMEEDCGK